MKGWGIFIELGQIEFQSRYNMRGVDKCFSRRGECISEFGLIDDRGVGCLAWIDVLFHENT